MNALPYIRGTVFDESGCLSLLAMCLVVGILTGLLRDIFHVFFSEQNRVVVFFSDMLTGLFSYVSLFTCALNENYGIVRWYHVVIAVIGFRLYRIVFSPPIRRILGFFSKMLRRLLEILLFPIGFFAEKGKHFLYRMKKSVLLRRRKVQYNKAKKHWLRLAARGFDCFSPVGGRNF